MPTQKEEVYKALGNTPASKTPTPVRMLLRRDGRRLADYEIAAVLRELQSEGSVRLVGAASWRVASDHQKPPPVPQYNRSISFSTDLAVMTPCQLDSEF